MREITVSDYKRAYELGKRHAKECDLCGWYTPFLQASYDLGYEGIEVDFSKISGAKKNAWWYTTKDGKLEYIGEFNNGVHTFQHDSGYCSGNDHILIVVDSNKNYLDKTWTELPDAQLKYISDK